jgi:ParB-like chromosome segregation protein Spo0J
MTSYSDLQDALRDRLAIVADHAFRDRDAAGHLNAIRKAASRLDALIAGLPEDLDPMLRHYLERQSYAKAIDWLDAHMKH